MSLYEKVGGIVPSHNGPDLDLRRHLDDILRDRQLTPVFQPIVDIQFGAILGYEGLIRGPSGGPLHLPLDMFRVAREHGLTTELEILCCHTLIERFIDLELPGRLFLNISPGVLLQLGDDASVLINDFRQLGLYPNRVVLELTEDFTQDCHELNRLVSEYRQAGFELALDDLGNGYSSLRRWSEFRPDYVKVDMHFIQGIHDDGLKQQFVRSIRDIAQQSGALVVAEGIEHQEELKFLLNIGVRSGQGFYIARPERTPLAGLSDELVSDLHKLKTAAHAWKGQTGKPLATAGTLLRNVPCASPTMTNDEVCELFSQHPDLQSVPVVDNGVPQGMIQRDELIGRFARPYQRELYGRRNCTLFMDVAPPMIDHSTSLQKLGHILTDTSQSRLFSDFIIIGSDGKYLGIGTTQDLLRELTEVQILHARHANPLTQLPGNLPLNLHIEHLLAQGECFSACYADLDNFKPFNDIFGYVQGDEVIQMTGALLRSHTSDDDFVGHIGGDDFLVIWKSPDWESRCHCLLDAFSVSMRAFLDSNCLVDKHNPDGYLANDRHGSLCRFEWPSLSLGVILVEPAQFDTCHDIATAAAEAKAQAKTISGNSLYVERRRAVQAR